MDCARCGKQAALSFGSQRLCRECFQVSGSCCLEFGGDDVTLQSLDADHQPPIPDFFDPRRVGTLFYPDSEAIAAAAEHANLPPAENDRMRVCLLLIDMQVDFCHPHGALYVPGAREDLRRMIDLLFRNAEHITRIICSLDAHYPIQIFHAAWWQDAHGCPPPPYTMITAHDVENGTWRPRRDKAWSRRYVNELQQHARKNLVIWPYHVPIGGPGNALDPSLWSAVFWHALARRSQPVFWSKGSHPLTEHYSILRPEVPVADEPGHHSWNDLMAQIAAHDVILLAGEAETHCVLETLRDLLTLLETPEQRAKLYVVRDGMSPVQHPEIDFHTLAMESFEDFRRLGVHFINSTGPMPWEP